MKLQQVHVRVNDAATGEPTPVRLRITDEAGAYFAPFGRLTAFATDPGVDVGANVRIDGEAWAFIDGACEIALPPGNLRVQVRKGPEFRPLDVAMQLQAGKLSMRLTIERHSDLRSAGWYSGDIESSFISPHAALLEAGAEDLAVVNLLIRERMIRQADGSDAATLTNIAAFSGQEASMARPGHLVAVNTLNESHRGRLLLLNCHRVVFPLSFGPDDSWGLGDWCDQCHRKGGLVVADTVVEELRSRVDAYQFLGDLQPWTDALNRGWRLPLVAGSGKASNGEVLGAWRTYARVDGEFSYKTWIEAVRAGRVWITSGPILHFTVNEKEPGATLTSEDKNHPARVVAKADGRLEIIVNGDTVLSGEHSVDALLDLRQCRWLAAVCRGPHGLRAVTSPVYGS